MTKFPNYVPTPPLHGLIGHRGLCGVAPENTLSSFKAAVQHGLSWIELDVRLSSDGVLVCIHDHKVERTTSDMGAVCTFDYAALNHMDATSWFDPDYEKEGIPTLLQVANYFAQQNIPLQINVEIKTPHPPCIETNIQLKEAILQEFRSWPSQLPLPVISCFDWNILGQIRLARPDLTLGFLTEHCSEAILMEVQSFSNCAVHCNARNLSDAFIAQALDLKIPILAYTVNNLTLATELLNKGVFGIFTDLPLHEVSFKTNKMAS